MMFEKSNCSPMFVHPSVERSCQGVESEVDRIGHNRKWWDLSIKCLKGWTFDTRSWRLGLGNSKDVSITLVFRSSLARSLPQNELRTLKMTLATTACHSSGREATKGHRVCSSKRHLLSPLCHPWEMTFRKGFPSLASRKPGALLL